jgi:hypothetical protein
LVIQLGQEKKYMGHFGLSKKNLDDFKNLWPKKFGRDTQIIKL